MTGESLRPRELRRSARQGNPPRSLRRVRLAGGSARDGCECRDPHGRQRLPRLWLPDMDPRSLERRARRREAVVSVRSRLLRPPGLMGVRFSVGYPARRFALTEAAVRVGRSHASSPDQPLARGKPCGHTRGSGGSAPARRARAPARRPRIPCATSARPTARRSAITTTRSAPRRSAGRRRDDPRRRGTAVTIRRQH